jgi:hypothetical protein
MSLSALSKLGIGIETSWGAGADPQINLPVEPYNLMFSFENTVDQSLRGEVALDFGIYQGVYSATGEISGHIFPDEVGYILSGFFGGPSTTGTQTPYEHTFTVEETPYSLALTDYVPGINTYQYVGMYVSEFGFSFSSSEGLLDFTSSLSGKMYSTSTATVPAATADDAFSGWMAAIIKGSDTQYANLIEFEANLARELTLVYTATNTQVVHEVYVGPMEASGTMTLDFKTEADLTAYLNNTSELLEVDFVNSTKEFKFIANKMNYGDSAPEIDRSNVNLQLVLNWRALHNSTDSGPCQIVVANGTSSYTSS